jgi:Fe-S-cluster-containing hydrogenase component 2
MSGYASDSLRMGNVYRSGDRKANDMAESSSRTIVRVQRSGRIEVDESLCLTCRECEVACSLYQEKECNPSLSRIRIEYDDFTPGLPSVIVCKQCDWPACLYACAHRWDEPAIQVDERTGARYVDPTKCRGCGDCLRACPLTPERSVIAFRAVGGKRIFFKCNLCYDRAAGPVCVQICPGDALSYVPAQDKRR